MVRATFAQLIEHFHLTPWDIERLTDRQIVELYYHERDRKTGEIEPVAEPPKLPEVSAEATPEEQLRYELVAIEQLVWAKLLTEADAYRAKVKLTAKFANQPIPTDAEIVVPEEVTRAKVITGERIR